MTVFTPLYLLQQKINHWAEMAILINNEFAPTPEGFVFFVGDSELVCWFIADFDVDKGDALTPPGEIPVVNDVVLRFSVETTAEEVYRYIQAAVESATERSVCRL